MTDVFGKIGNTDMNQNLFEFLVDSGKLILFQKGATSNVTTIPDKLPEHIILVLVNRLGSLSFQFQYDFTMSMFVASSLTIWIGTKNFIRYSLSASDNSFNGNVKGSDATLLCKRLTELIRLANAVNTAWMQPCDWIVIEIGIWFSKDFDILTKTNDYFFLGYAVLLIFNLCTGLILSAECSRMVISNIMSYFLNNGLVP